MIRPLRSRIIGRTARLATRYAPVRLVSTTEVNVVLAHQRQQLVAR